MTSSKYSDIISDGGMDPRAESDMREFNKHQRLLRIEKERNEAIELLKQTIDGRSDIHIDLYVKIDSYLANIDKSYTG